MWRVTGHNDRPTIKDTGGVRPARWDQATAVRAFGDMCNHSAQIIESSRGRPL